MLAVAVMLLVMLVLVMIRCPVMSWDFRLKQPDFNAICAYYYSTAKLDDTSVISENSRPLDPKKLNFFVSQACHKPVLDGFNQHHQTSVHCSKQCRGLTSATSKCYLKKK